MDSNFSRQPTYQINCNQSRCSWGSKLIINRYFLLKADDYEIEDNKKALDDVINNYQKEKLMARRNEIIQSLNNASLDKEKSS